MRTSRRSVNRSTASLGGYMHPALYPGRGSSAARFIVPMGGFAVLLLLASTLIGAIMLRPWAGPDNSWRTHLNLAEEPYANYSRSVQTFVSPEGSAPIQVWSLARCGQEERAASVVQQQRTTSVVEASTLTGELSLRSSWDVDSSSCSEPGRAEFVVHGCVSCHGLGARGGAFAPPLAGQNGNLVEIFVRRGPGGMPAFSEAEISPGHLAEIIAYLASLEPVAVEAKATPTPTPASAQAATPIPTSPAPPLVPLAEITYDATWPQWYLAQGKQINQSKCSACHELPSTKRIKAFDSDADMVEMVSIMTGVARLSDEDAAKVIRYLLALRHDTAP